MRKDTGVIYLVMWRVGLVFIMESRRTQRKITFMQAHLMRGICVDASSTLHQHHHHQYHQIHHHRSHHHHHLHHYYHHHHHQRESSRVDLTWQDNPSQAKPSQPNPNEFKPLQPNPTTIQSDPPHFRRNRRSSSPLHVHVESHQHHGVQLLPSAIQIDSTMIVAKIVDIL